MNNIKTWPPLATIGVVCLILGAVGAILWIRHERTAEASSLPGAARIDRVQGEVGLNRTLDSNAANAQWVEAEQNTPVSVGDRIYTKDKSDASVAFSGRNFARLNENTSLDVLALADEKTQVALRDGSAVFDIANLSSGELFEIATPCGAVDLTGPGLYQVEIDDGGNASATAFSGVAQVVGQGGTGRIEKGEVLTVPCEASSTPTLSRVESHAAGTLVDHYYQYRYPRTYDGRYLSYDTYLNDPTYYDPSRRFASYQYVSDYIPGVEDLDSYGDWQEVSNYGYCWHPRVDSGWAPYQSGHWTADYPYGLTWISGEPWGYAPYHYGRWTFAGDQWFWVPDRVRTRPAYSPALVAFIPLQTETIGWVPLAPGDPYEPRYYDSNWTPRYLNRTRAIQERVINLNVPGAVTFVNMRAFNRAIDRRSIERVGSQQFANVRPVLDPFAVRNFRDVALRTREVGRRFDVSPQIAQRIERPVITSITPVTPYRRDLAQRLQARPVPEKMRGQQWQLRDNRSPATAGLQTSQPQSAPNQTNPNQANIAAQQARERQMADLSREAARGNRVARQQVQQLQRQQRQEQQQQREQVAAQRRAERIGVQPAPGESVSKNVQPRRSMEQQQRERQPAAQQPSQTNPGRQNMRITPQPRGLPAAQRQQDSARQVWRQRQPQNQPGEGLRSLRPHSREGISRGQTPPPQAAPQPRPMRAQREPQAQRRIQPQPRPQPQAQRPPNQMRQQQQARPQSQPQQKKNERHPPGQTAAAQPQNKKGREHP